MALKITFIDLNTNQTVTVDAVAGELLTQAAYRAGVQIKQTCGGTPSCTDCKIVVKEGINDAFESPEGAELRLLGNVYFITKERLACQAIIKQDSTIVVPKYESKAATQSKLSNRFKASKARRIEKDYGEKEEKTSKKRSTRKKLPKRRAAKRKVPKNR